MKKLLTIGAFLAMGLATLAAPSSASGQSMAFGIENPSESFRPDINSREIRIIARLLSLGEIEREAMQDLHDGHAAAIAAKGDEVTDLMQSRVEEAQATGDIATTNVTAEQREAWTKEADEMRRTFLEDLKSLLTKEQADRWPLVERELRRYRALGKGTVAGESTDVVRIVDEFVPESWSVPGVTEVLVGYAANMDSLLKTRDELTSSERQTAFHNSLNSDRAAAEKMWDESVTARMAVRDLNLKTASTVANMLPPDAGEKLRRKVFEASYPSLTRHTKTESYIRAAPKLDSLTPEQREQLDSLMQTYDRRLAELLKQMATLINERERDNKPPGLGSPNSGKVATTADGETVTFFSSADVKFNPDDPMTKLKKQRFTYEQEVKRQINAILTKAQQDACRQPTEWHVLIGENTRWGL